MFTWTEKTHNNLTSVTVVRTSDASFIVHFVKGVVFIGIVKTK